MSEIKIKEKPLNTALVHGTTVKTDPKIEFFGNVDMLQAYIMELTHYTNNEDLNNDLRKIVKTLSFIMGIVAGVNEEFKAENISYLLDLIKKYKTSPDVLTEFVLPGKTLVGAKVHIVRTIVRTCERRYAMVYEKYQGNDVIFEYLNKLSTLFYELGCYYDNIKD